MNCKKITTGVYRYDFPKPVSTRIDSFGKCKTYVGYMTCGVDPKSVYDILSPSHNTVVDDYNVTVISDDGDNIVTKMSVLKKFLKGDIDFI